jgi:hypothetical protein
MLDPDVRWHGGNPSAAGACHNRTEALQFMRDGFARGGVGELIDVVGVGDKVVAIMRPPADGSEPAGPDREPEYLPRRQGRRDGPLPGSGRGSGGGGAPLVQEHGPGAPEHRRHVPEEPLDVVVRVAGEGDIGAIA